MSFTDVSSPKRAVAPAIEILAEATRFAFSNFWSFVADCAPWALLFVVVERVPWIILGDYKFNVSTMQDAKAHLPEVVAISIYFLSKSIAYVFVAIAWHRRTLPWFRKPNLSPVPGPAAVWAYWSNLAYLFGLMSVVAMLVLPLIITFLFFAFSILGIPLSSVFAQFATVGMEGNALVWPFVFVFILVFQRLSLKLPALALNRGDIGFRKSWRLTSGYNLQLLAVAIAVYLLQQSFILASHVVGLVLGPSLIAAIIQSVSHEISNWLVMLAGVSALSATFAYFVGSLVHNRGRATGEVGFAGKAMSFAGR